MFKKILAFLPLLFAVACSNGGKGAEGKGVYNFDNKDTAMKVFEYSKIECSGDCPPNVGGITTYTDEINSYTVGVCSMTYIGNNQILTNKHCLPKDLALSKSTYCTGRIKIRFPKTGIYPDESFNCSEISSSANFDVHTKENDVVKPDWAIIKFVGSTSRPAATLDTTTGLKHGLTGTLYPVFYSLLTTAEFIKVSGSVRRTICKINRKSDISDYFFGSFSALFSADTCDRTIIHGNSGSGMQNDAGQLIGLLSFGKVSGGPAFGGTNIACIPALGPIHDHCQFEDTDDFKLELFSLSVMTRANEFGDNIAISNSSGGIFYDHLKMYRQGPQNNAEIVSINYKDNGDVHLNDGLNKLMFTSLSEYISTDKIECIDKKKLGSETSLYIPLKIFDPAIWNVSGKYPMIEAPVKFQLTFDGTQYLAKLDDIEKPSVKRDADDLESFTDKCETEKVNGSFLSLSCNYLLETRKEIEKKSLDEQSRIYGQNYLSSIEATSLTISIPACAD